MEYDPLAAKCENWNITTEQIDANVTLFEILEELRSLKEKFEKSEEENKRLIESLRDEIRDLKAEVSELKAFHVDPEYKLLPTMPFDSMCDLRDFDEKLPLYDDMRAEFKNFLQRINDTDYRTFLRKAMRAIVTDELAINLTWRGTNEKPSIQRFNVLNIARDICQVKFTTANLDDMNRICQQHFLHAKDRVLKKKKTQFSSSTPPARSVTPPPPRNPIKITSSPPHYPPPSRQIKAAPAPASRKVRNFTPPPSPPSNILPTMPFITLMDLQEFDDNLVDDSKLKGALKRYINKIEGRDYATFVRSAFRAILTDEVAIELTWRGTKDKPSVQEFTIFAIIRKICHSKYSGTTNLEINKVCQQHFLHARDRVQKRIKLS